MIERETYGMGGNWSREDQGGRAVMGPDKGDNTTEGQDYDL